MKKKIALIAVFVLLTAAIMALGVSAANVWDGTAATGFASGSGTEADPYIIMTAEQLKYFADQVNGGNKYSDKFIKLGDDIVLNDTTNWENWDKTAPKNTWTAIGNYSKYFSGTFDGDGHTVSGIYVYTETDYQGLFGYAKKAAIKNLGTEKSYIKGCNSVGGVVGYNYDGTVSNCYNTGTVSGYGSVGGVAGHNYYATVSNCYNTGTVSGNNYNVGGVAGRNRNGTVINCYNTGTVSGNKYVGGVVGCNDYDYYYSTVSNCYNTGTVSGTDLVGGVVGYNEWNGTVSNCYNTGAVSGNHRVGGVVGSKNSNSTVSNCYNTGTVNGDYDVGGVVGENYSLAFRCYYLVGCATDGNGTVQRGIGNETTGKRTADVSGNTAGLTDAQMKRTASFAGFDFDTVWTIGVVEGYDYPTLRWQKDEDPNEPDEPKGCGSAIGAGTGVMCVALLLGVCVTTKKRK